MSEIQNSKPAEFRGCLKFDAIGKSNKADLCLHFGKIKVIDEQHL